MVEVYIKNAGCLYALQMLSGLFNLAVTPCSVVKK